MTLKSKIQTFRLISLYCKNSPIEILIAYFNHKKKLKLYFFKETLSWNDIKALSYAYSFGWSPKKEKSKFYFENKKSKRKFFIPFYKNGLFTEDYKDFYGIFNYKGKNVLDVGGYVGDTLLFFFENGAKKVHCYEPIKENLEIIRENFKKEIKTKKLMIFPFAVCGKEGKINFFVDSNTIGQRDFGGKRGKTKIELNCTSWKKIINSEKFDIAKVDCEGGELWLKNCSSEELKKIPNWVIEAHNKKIEKILLKKFKDSGFSLIKNQKINSKTSILSFKL